MGARRAALRRRAAGAPRGLGRPADGPARARARAPTARRRGRDPCGARARRPRRPRATCCAASGAARLHGSRCATCCRLAHRRGDAARAVRAGRRPGGVRARGGLARAARRGRAARTAAPVPRDGLRRAGLREARRLRAQLQLGRRSRLPARHRPRRGLEAPRRAAPPRVRGALGRRLTAVLADATPEGTSTASTCGCGPRAARARSATRSPRPTRTTRRAARPGSGWR